ncbi:SGNH/GDSL hydrolase family protein [Thermodesulfobacteriota bacterium]
MLQALFVFAFLISIIVFDNRQDILLHFVQVSVVWVFLFVLLMLPHLISRWRQILIALAATVISLLVLWLSGPYILHKLVLPLYNLDIDHRPKHEPGYTNEDGVQPDIPSTQYQEKDFNIIFLGDSFTAGKFPFYVDHLLKTHYHHKSIRTVNFGWASSSPVLQLRQLDQIGAKYNPDLVVHSFDMTDFWDDILYSAHLSELNLDNPKEISIFHAMKVRYSLLMGVNDFYLWFKEQLIGKDPEIFTIPFMTHRYFHTQQPLSESEPFFEITWNTILKIHSLLEEMGVKYVLFIHPRYQQYNRKECPYDIENPPLSESNEFILEPFKYFKKQALTASFPIHSLLEDFRNCGVFPTVRESDPHYNDAGNWVAAKAITKYLIADGFLEDDSE